jgi:glucose-1-phosphatase
MLNSHITDKLKTAGSELPDIKNIIFDLGGVIIELHSQDTVEAFKKLGFLDFESIYTQIKQTHLFDLFETGKIPPQAFRIELRKFRNNLSDIEIDQAWNMMIGPMPSFHLPLLRSVKKQYRTFLLSNTNAIHIEYFYHYLNGTYGYNALNDMFDKVYYSHEIGLRKPSQEAFEKVLEDAGIKAHETLFIDDLMANVEGARKAGLWAYHLDNECIRDIFVPQDIIPA